MTPWLDDGDVRLYRGDALAVLAALPAGSVQACVTSPPYWGLRDYGAEGQIGLEESPDAYVAALVAVFAEVRRVLRDDGTLWLNLGDSYAGHSLPGWRAGNEAKNGGVSNKNGVGHVPGMKPKDLVGIPWRVAFALQADGWYLRSDIIWSKPNPMPESVTDRPTKAHEYLFLLAKSQRYFYDADAIAEPSVTPGDTRHLRLDRTQIEARQGGDSRLTTGNPTGTSRNARSVWEIATQPFPEAHFATFPEALPRRCILAGTSEAGECSMCGTPWQRQTERTPMVIDRSSRTHSKGHTRSSGTMLEPPTSVTTGWEAACTCDVPPHPQTVLDPFAGSGTTALVARKHGRRSIGIDLSEEYLSIAATRLSQQSLFSITPTPTLEDIPL